MSSTSTARVRRRGVLRGVVADTQPLWRMTLAAILDRLGFGSVAGCARPEELRELVLEVRPHLVVVDLDDFAEAEQHLEAVQSTLPSLTVVAVSARSDAQPSDPLVSKQWEACEIEQRLRELVRERLDWAATLSARELEILRLVADGTPNRAVAAALWLSDQTVKFHLANAYRKLGVSSRFEAVERLREAGLLVDVTLTTSVAPSAAERTGEAATLDTRQ